MTRLCSWEITYLCLLVCVFLVDIAFGQPIGFVEDFSGPGINPIWNKEGDPGNHPLTVAGSYDFTDNYGPPGTKINRSMSGTYGSFTQELELVFDPFGLTGSDGTQTDFKWKTFGADGYMEIVLNSFGNMRLWHNDFSGGADNIKPYTSIGYDDGDHLKLTMAYDMGTDTVEYSYSLNGGVSVPFYSGGGLHGPIGDIITGFVEAQLFKWGNAPSQATAAIERWSVVPTSLGDFNSDGLVNGIDFLLLQRDSNVGSISDWESNYDSPPLASATLAVPEPGGYFLVVAPITIALINRFRCLPESR